MRSLPSHRRRYSQRWLSLLLVLAVAASAVAQVETTKSLSPEVTLDEVGQVTLSQLDRAEKLFEQRQWSDGFEALQGAQDRDGDRLIRSAVSSALKSQFNAYVPLYRECTRRLCRLSPEGLTAYRSQIDADANAAWDAARTSGDLAAMERVERRYFASSIGDDVALRRGDELLRLGNVAAARAAWESIYPTLRVTRQAADALRIRSDSSWYLALRSVPLEKRFDDMQTWMTSGDRLCVVHPDADVGIANVRARLILASIQEGDVPRAAWELEIFQRLHGDAVGRFGSKSGKWIDLLQDALERSRTWPTLPGDAAWPTFAGSPRRNAVANDDPDIAGRPLWSLSLPRHSGERDIVGQDRLRVAEDRDGLLSYHPGAIDDWVLLPQGHTLQAYHLKTGKKSWEIPLGEPPQPAKEPRRQAGVPRFTVSTAENTAAFVMPTPSMLVSTRTSLPRENWSRLGVIDLRTRKLLFGATVDDPLWQFEGSPLLERGRLYVGIRKQSEVRPELFVACFDIGTQQRVWRRSICAAESIAHDDAVQFANNLLTMSDGVVYYNTNFGAVAAIEAASGEVRWITKYPRAEFPSSHPDRPDRHFFRDLNPCLLHDGLVICAPADCNRMFALDAASGELVWTTPPHVATDVVHLLGVAQGCLIASGDYLYWFDALSGKLVTQFPAAMPTGPNLALPVPRGWGRGVLTKARVYWPTAEAIYLFDVRPIALGGFRQPQAIGKIDLVARNVAGGNLVIAEGKMILAGVDKLTVFAEVAGDRAAADANKPESP